MVFSLSTNAQQHDSIYIKCHKSVAATCDVREMHFTNQNMSRLDWSENESVSYVTAIQIQNNKLTETVNFSRVPYAFYQIFPELISMTFNYVNITEIEIGDLKNLASLEINRCSLRALRANIFVQSPGLMNLTLMWNKITSIDKDTFKGVQYLVNLNLEGNQLKFTHNHVLRKLPSLKFLSLSNNPLKSFSIDFFRSLARTMTGLSLSNLNLTDISPNAFDNLTALMSLDLRKNLLTELSVKLFESISDLWYLDLSYNLLEAINLHPLKYLKNANLSNNKLTKLDKEMFGNINPIQLNVTNNLITEIDPELFGDKKYFDKIQLAGNFCYNEEEEFEQQDLTLLKIKFSKCLNHDLM